MLPVKSDPSIPQEPIMPDARRLEKSIPLALVSVSVLAGLYLTSLYSYLLFHTLGEMFSTAVAIAIFLLVWNVRQTLDNDYLLFLGMAYLYIGGLDLVHTLAYKGMGVFTGFQENLPTQLWIAARYLQSVSLLVAPVFIGRPLNVRVVLGVYTVVVSLLLGAIFYWDVFPDCYVPGKGLTPFKQISEYVIGGILVTSMLVLSQKQDRFDSAVLRLIMVSIGLTVLSELFFSIYVEVYGILNLLGHYLKIVAFFCIYKAIIEIGMTRPFQVLFRDLTQSRESLQAAHDDLERRVEERTADLVQANRNLAWEMEERLRAVEDREVERKKLLSILENMPDGVYIADRDRNILYANPVLERNFGPISGKKCHQYLDGRETICPWCRGPEVFAGQTLRWEWKSEITGKIYELFDTPIRQADGSVVRLEILHDVTWRKQAEDALRDSETKFRIVAENTYDWEWWIDPNGKFVYVSPSCREITHHSPEEFIQDPDLLFRMVHPDDLPEVSRHVQETEGNRIQGEVEFRIRLPDGDIRWIAHACLPVFDDAGNFLGRRGNNRDITDRKNAEKALQTSEERYRALVETMNEGFGIADENEIWTYANEKLCDMLGHDSDELVGKSVENWLDEDNRAILRNQLARRRKGEPSSYELSWIRKDGSLLHTLASPRPIFGENGRYQGSFAVLTDITERKKAEESVLEAFSQIRVLKDRLEAENVFFRQEMQVKHQFEQIIGNSNAIKYVLYRAEQVAPTSTTVLIQGETGTGKELIAAAIHRMSQRKDKPMITVNCAALPANLIESELFGREKGAFTGADARREGRFEIADGSTICLDEIGEMPLDVQSKLLRVIQHGQFERLGSSRTIHVDVRILATTNRNLDQEVQQGRFRQDLFYRLNVFPLTVPPLRQRKEDIPLLVQAFAERYGRELGKPFSSVHPETLRALTEYDWPGNIRELENVIERAVILCSGPVLHLAEKLESQAVLPRACLKTLEESEREQILTTLSATHWRINGKDGAAAILGLNPSTLRARMHKLGIQRPRNPIPKTPRS
jgi:PAS domain S-box-containing protein